jgi:hypothetical protein
MLVFVDRQRGTFHAPGSGMTCSRYALVAIVLVAAACGGAVNTASDGTGGGLAAGGSGGSVSVGGSGNGTGGILGTGGTSGGTGTGGTAGTTSTACGVIQASDYDQSCKADSDCVIVFSGDTCTDQFRCENATINKNAAAGYHPIIPVGGAACYCGMPGIASCIGGVCTMCPPNGCPVKDAGPDAPKCGVIRASDYDQSCKSAQDCTVVFEGDSCNDCGCPNAPINRVAALGYHPVFGQNPNVCDCMMVPLPSCVSGVCKTCLPAGCPMKDSSTGGSGGSGGTGGATAAGGSGGGTTAPCPFSCPATWVGIVLEVTAATDGGVVSGAEATLSGPTTETMSCEANGTVTICRWPSGAVTAGTYSLQVAAAGFRTANESATVTVTPDPRCGCVWASLQPSVVTLDPA